MLYKLMLCKIKTCKKRILKTILTDFSRKEKVITRYPRIYIKLNGRDDTKQANIQTDHVMEARRPDSFVVDKKERSCKIIDFSVPGDSKIELKEKDKIEKYQDLGRKLQKYGILKEDHTISCKLLDAVPKQFGNRLK